MIDYEKLKKHSEPQINDVETNAIKIVMQQIDEYCSKMTSDEKREALKKASSYTTQTQKPTYIDDINNITINGKHAIEYLKNQLEKDKLKSI